MGKQKDEDESIKPLEALGLLFKPEQEFARSCDDCEEGLCCEGKVPKLISLEALLEKPDCSGQGYCSGCGKVSEDKEQRFVAIDYTI